MTTYKLDNLEGGLAVLRSGRWRCYVIRLNSLPEDVCEAQYLLFANESEAGDVMRVRIPSGMDEVDDDAVAAYATNPDERSFSVEGARYDVYPPFDDSRERMWRVRPERGHPYRTDTAIETPLGELKSDDLQEIASVRLG